MISLAIIYHLIYQHLNYLLPPPSIELGWEKWRWQPSSVTPLLIQVGFLTAISPTVIR